VAHDAIHRATAVICEPIWFELLRLAAKSDRKRVEMTLNTIPILHTPADLWRKATGFGQQCKDSGIQASFADLLIGTICLHRSAVSRKALRRVARQDSEDPPARASCRASRASTD